MTKDTGKVSIHGKEYSTVAYRVSQLREEFKQELSIVTDIISADEEIVVMKASILDKEGRVIATGHAEEKRSSSQINRTSALENAETSAIGRALAAFGMAGTEFASADEVANAITQQAKPNYTPRTPVVPSANKLQMLKGQIRAELHKNGIADEDSHDYIKREYGYDGIKNKDQAVEVLEKLRKLT